MRIKNGKKDQVLNLMDKFLAAALFAKTSKRTAAVKIHGVMKVMLLFSYDCSDEFT